MKVGSLLHRVGPGNQSEVVKLGGRHLCQQSLVPSSQVVFYRKQIHISELRDARSSLRHTEKAGETVQRGRASVTLAETPGSQHTRQLLNVSDLTSREATPFTELQ